jgi:hypothetical protein
MVVLGPWVAARLRVKNGLRELLRWATPARFGQAEEVVRCVDVVLDRRCVKQPNWDSREQRSRCVTLTATGAE